MRLGRCSECGPAKESRLLRDKRLQAGQRIWCRCRREASRKPLCHQTIGIVALNASLLLYPEYCSSTSSYGKWQKYLSLLLIGKSYT
jgi:hypothetical protein